jgi:hypothetical protein
MISSHDLRMTTYALLVLTGCATSSLSPSPFASQSALQSGMASGGQSTIGNLESDQPAPMIFAFHYSAPLTNGYLESSTDLLHWTVREDYWIGTNADGTTYWNLRSNKSNRCEFYRIGGDAIQ